MFSTRQLTRGATLLALALVIPFAFHAIGGSGLGKILLPMHLPVLIAGFLCGPIAGLFVGILAPLLSSIFTGMSPMMPPVAQMMVFELGLYGFLTGVLSRTRLGVYPTLIMAMAGGRLLYGFLGFFILPLFGLNQVPLFYPLTYGLVTGLPGIVV